VKDIRVRDRPPQRNYKESFLSSLFFLLNIFIKVSNTKQTLYSLSLLLPIQTPNPNSTQEVINFFFIKFVWIFFYFLFNYSLYGVNKNRFFFFFCILRVFPVNRSSCFLGYDYYYYFNVFLFGYREDLRNFNSEGF